MRQPNEAAAILFYQLGLGDRCISQLLSAHNVVTLDEFRAFLAAIVEQLQPGEPGGGDSGGGGGGGAGMPGG